MLARGVADSDVARILPRVTAELRRWDGRALPDDNTFAALVADIREAREAGTLASAATRLNYDVAGFISLLEQPAGAGRPIACTRAVAIDRSGASRDVGATAAPTLITDFICRRRSICATTPTARSSARRRNNGPQRARRTLWLASSRSPAR
jgi:hypothetical protein